MQKAIDGLRRQVDTLEDDRYLAGDLETAATLVRERALVAESGIDLVAPLGTEAA